MRERVFRPVVATAIATIGLYYNYRPLAFSGIVAVIIVLVVSFYLMVIKS